MSIVKRIREEGKKYGMTIASIERNTQISNGTIGKWDKSVPSVENIYKVSKLLNVSMEYLLFGEKTDTNLSLDEIEWLELYREIPDKLKKDLKHECHGYISGFISATSEKK